MAFTLRGIREPRGFGPLLVVAAGLPLAFAIGGLGSDLLLNTRYFGANPVRTAEHFLGLWTLRLLLLTLAITPLRRLTGWVWLIRHRRTLGLYAFAYLSAHWLVYALLDIQLDWQDLAKDLMKRPYITIGMAALVLMTPLAITSTRGWRIRLGKRWQLLHRLSYLVAVAGCTHFFMAVKKDLTSPIVYAAVLVLLLGARLLPAGWISTRST